MQRIDTSRAVTSRPAQGAEEAPPGFFSEGNPALGQLPTELSGEWCNGIQESIIRTILGGLVTPTPGALGDTNLLEAIKTLHRPIADAQMSSGFVPAAQSAYTVSLVRAPVLPVMVFATSWLNTSIENPPPLSGSIWCFQNTLLINGIEVMTSDTAVSSIVFGMSTVPANIGFQVQSRIVTSLPSAPFSKMQHGAAYIAFPWAS